MACFFKLRSILDVWQGWRAYNWRKRDFAAAVPPMGGQQAQTSRNADALLGSRLRSICRALHGFLGSACLFYALRPAHALLSDINGDLVDTVTRVKEHPRAVYNATKRIERGPTSYYRVRSLDPSSLNPIERAARFIFLNRFCFNGLYRTNKTGRFNVPYSASRTGDLPTWAGLRSASEALQTAEIRCSDFEGVLAEAQKGDFVYLDPPYAIRNRRVFRQYDPHSFGVSDIARLAAALIMIDRKGVRFVLSYAYCAEAVRAFSGWPVRKLFVQPNISGFRNTRRLAAELVVSHIRNSEQPIQT